MAKYRKIDPRIWNDQKFRELSDSGKLTFFFLLTHPHMTSLGAMRATVPGLASELGWKEKAFAEAFQEASSKGMVKHDPKACFVWLPNFLKYNRPESPNVIKSWTASLDYLPECELKNELILQVKSFAGSLPKAFTKALPEGFRKTMPNQEQEQEQEQEQYIPPLPPAKKSESEIDYPSWLDMVLWGEFKKHRKEIKVPLSILAEKKNLTELEKLIKLDNDYREVINQTIANGWKGFFEVKNKNPKQITGDHRTNHNIQACMSFLEKESELERQKEIL